MLPDGTPLGRYRTIRLIGEGGFGEVYLAEDMLIQRNVAIKVIKPQQNPHKLQEALRLFQREMRVIAQLDHPHILPLYDFGEATVNGTKYAYMVMPYCKDGTLETWLDERKDNHFPFPSLHDVAQILSQAADALQQAHDHPDKILHLDVKPSNFLIRTNKDNPNCPYLLLADFGIAKFAEASGEFSTTVRGSIEYMPSEQSRSNPQSASDQYALALMMYRVLTYQLPFKGNYAQLLYQHLDVMPAAPSTFNPRIPPEIDTVILKALAKKYEDRYPTITAFADAFNQALINNTTTRVILSISKTEAETGGSYPLKLFNERQVTVAIPAGVQDRDEIRQEGLGISAYDSGPSSALITTIIIKPESESERMIASQLQKLEQDIQALRTNPPLDQNLLEQIQLLSTQLSQLNQNPDMVHEKRFLKISARIQNIFNPQGTIKLLLWLCFIALSLVLGIWGNTAVQTYFYAEQDYFNASSFSLFGVVGIGAAVLGLVFLFARGRFIVDILGGIAFTILSNLLLGYSAYLFYASTISYNLSNGYYSDPTSGTFLHMLELASSCTLLLLFLTVRFFVRSAKGITGAILGSLIAIEGCILLFYVQHFFQSGWTNPLNPNFINWSCILQILLGIAVIIIALRKRQYTKQIATNQTGSEM